jgi:hypothetical protein
MSQYRDYAFIKIFHCNRVCHIQRVLILRPDLRGLHRDNLAQSLHYALILKEQDCICVLLETGQGETGVIVL